MPVEIVETRPIIRVDSEVSKQVFVTSITDAAIEAGADLLPHERVNKYILVLTSEGKVINPELDERDLTEHLRFDTEKDKLESEAALKVRSALITEDENTLVVWFSSPRNDYGYKEGRVTAGRIQVNGEQKILESYGIPVLEEDTHQFLFSAWRLSEFSRQQLLLENTEDLRANPIVIDLPSGENPWMFLSQYIQLEKVWETISDGSVELKRQEVLRDSREVGEIIMPLIQNARTQGERDQVIIYATQLMAERGRPIDPKKLCDLPSALGGSILGTKIRAWAFETPGVCVKCKAAKKLGPCGICEDCNDKIDANEMSFAA